MRAEAASQAWDAVFNLVFHREGQKRFFAACEATGLTPGVLKALLQLESHKPLPMRDIAGIFRCDPSWVTSLVDGLEEAGLAQRQAHPTDRRVKVVALTDLGAQTQIHVNKLLSEPPEVFNRLSDNELVQLRDLVSKLTT